MNRSPKVLIVEDNPTNLKLAADVLKYDGFEVLCAPDAETAKLILYRTRPDLILMDLQIPGQDGLALTRQLKADPQFNTIKIVALTASAMRGDSQRAFDAGCDGYIAKPIDTRELTAQVRNFLDAEEPGNHETEYNHERTDRR